MTQGMFAAVSGVRANLARLNVISNNIANLNTIAFKSSSVAFGTVFSQTYYGGSRPTDALGGTNPKQVGVGVQVLNILKNFNPGGAQYTGVGTDVFINGQGFFVVQKADAATGVATGFVLTRAGNYSLDSNGNLVSTPDGQKVRGTSQLSGTSSTTVFPITVPQSMVIIKDLDATGAILATHFANDTVTGAAITAAAAAGTATQQIDNVKLSNFTIGPDGAILATMSNGDRITVRTDQSTIDPLDPTAARREIVHLPAEGGSFAAFNVTATDSGAVNQITGFEQFQGPSGGVAMQGMQLQVQTATVTNPQGLLEGTANTFEVGANSGDNFFGIPSTENRGPLQSGALESSNVDLAGEFSTMIITQRGLEASSKVIRTNDEVLQAIINIL